MLWQRDDLPEELAAYSVVHNFNRSGTLRYYPGSPLIARQLLRPQDKIHLTELHLSDYPLLRSEFQKDERASAARRRLSAAEIPAAAPVAPRLILMDPPYEMKTDYRDVVKGIQEGYKRFATGTYALWYPVVMRQQIKRMLRDLEATGIRRILQIELAVKPDSDQRGMTASGMIVINPP